MSIIIGALGSIIGYLGAEAATESSFERFLWPERFYNDANPYVLLRLALFLPMAGPLHGAALESLATFRENGLYLGMRRGNMLGTTFFHDTGIKYHHLTGPGPNQDEGATESRNGFWVQVLREVKCQNRAARLLALNPSDKIPPYRAMQLVHHLKLHYAKDSNKAGTVLSEFFLDCHSCYRSNYEAFQNILANGLSACTIGFEGGVALFVSVQRDPILDDKEKTEGRPESEEELYRIEDPMHGFAIIQGPASVVLQFFRHYGHPKRDTGAAGRRDRTRELLSMALVYLFVLYFQLGLSALCGCRPTRSFFGSAFRYTRL